MMMAHCMDSHAFHRALANLAFYQADLLRVVAEKDGVIPAIFQHFIFIELCRARAWRPSALFYVFFFHLVTVFNFVLFFYSYSSL